MQRPPRRKTVPINRAYPTRTPPEDLGAASAGSCSWIVPVHESRVISVQNCIEPRACSEGASVDPTDARKATVRRFGRSDRRAQRSGRGVVFPPAQNDRTGPRRVAVRSRATPRRSWVAVIRIKIGAGSIGDSYWIPTEACPHSLMRPQGPGDSPGCDVGGATAGARRRPRYRRTRPRYLGILKSKYVSLIAPGPNLPGQPTGEPARGSRTQRRHSMPMIGVSSRKSCQ